MVWWLFGRKKEVEGLKEEVRESFDKVKKDIEDIGKWLKHFDSKHSGHDSRFSGLHDRLSTIENEISELKNTLAMVDIGVFKRLFKTPKQVFKKQTAVEGVQTPVQTAVQTGDIVNFSAFSVMERALVYVLLNTDMKLSYDDLAAMLGKSRATIRGQINSIKQKSEGLVEELIERNGKKRLYIPENIKEKLLKKVKVRVSKRGKKKEEPKNYAQ
jgi:transcriptional antiterminator